MFKQIFKTLVLVLALFVTSTNCTNGQTFKANYTYDANGNRLTANVIFLSSASSNAPPIIEEEVEVDLPAALAIKIYPNPTQGDLRIEVTGGNQDFYNNPNNGIKVWDMQGKLLINIKSIGENNRVDFTTFSKGAYIMHITLNGKTKDYKIVKN